MTSNCGKMSLLLPFIAMLIQNVYPTPTPSNELAAVDPFDNIPEELKLTGWEPEELEDDPSKLMDLALLGLNKIRAANGVTENLRNESTYMMGWSKIVSNYLGKSLAEQEDKFTLPTKDDASVKYFEKVFYYKKEQTEVSTSDLLVETIRDWYKKAQTDVKNGAKKESILLLDPKTEYISLGFDQHKSEKDESATYYNCVINFATGDQFQDFKKLVDAIPETTPEVTTNSDGTASVSTTSVSTTAAP